MNLFRNFAVVVVGVVSMSVARADPVITLLKDELLLSSTITFDLLAGGSQVLSQRYEGPLIGNSDPTVSINRETRLSEFALTNTNPDDREQSIDSIRSEIDYELLSNGFAVNAEGKSSSGLWDFPERDPVIDGYAVEKTTDAILEWTFDVSGGDVDLHVSLQPGGTFLAADNRIYTTLVSFLLYDRTLDQVVESRVVFEQFEGESFNTLLLDGHEYSMNHGLSIFETFVRDWDDEEPGSSLVFKSLEFENAVLRVADTPKRCDTNDDGTVDIYDIRMISLNRNQLATGPDDPMDWDENGEIDILDARGCQQACTFPRCAAH